ncbi:MAG: winged helix-turn-helix transcriptional regulator [Halapricum sp.]
MEYRLDEIDRRIIHELMRDARDTSAPEIADAVSVSPGTIRNRIGNLEEHGIIRGYTASIDFEEADGRLTNLYICTVPVAERESLAREVSAVPGVINVRELMTGKSNLHVLAVGADTDDLRRISRALSRIGVEIEDEDLLQTETNSPYAAFGPERDRLSNAATDFISLTGEASVVEITVDPDAPITGRTLADAAESGVLDDASLVIAIERDDRVLTPHGETAVEADDIVTLLVRGGDPETAVEPFVAGQS